MSHPARIAPELPDHDGHFVMIPLNRGKFALVDEGDAEMVLSMGAWSAIPSSANWYAKRRIQGTSGYMHTLITGYDETDHINRNGLDNRRVNLRPATRSQNNANRPALRHNRHGYKGISLNWRTGKWNAYIRVDGQATYLGTFDDPVEAARTYNAAAAAAWGEYAWLNPLPEPGETIPLPRLPEPPPDEQETVTRIARALMEHPDACHWDRYILWRADIPAREMHATLKRLLASDWIKPEQNPGKTTGRYYRITETGKTELAALLLDLKAS